MARKKTGKRRASTKKPIKGEIVKLTQRLVRHSDPVRDSFDSDAFARLNELIRKQLDNNNEKVLYDTLSDLKTTEEFNQLQENIEDCVSSILVIGRRHSGEDLLMESQFFLIPIIGILDQSSDKVSLCDEDLSLVMKALRTHGLVTPENIIKLMPSLFSLSSIDKGYGQLYQLHKALIGSESPEGKWRLEQMASLAAESFSVDIDTLSLRFLVGTVIGEDVDFLRQFDDMRFDKEGNLDVLTEEDFTNIEEWGEEAGVITSKYFSLNAGVMVLEPQPFFDGVKSGIRSCEVVGAESSFRLALENQSIKPETTVIEVCPFDDRQEVSLILRDQKGQMVEAFNWNFFDVSEDGISETCEEITMLGNSLGVQRIKWVDGKKKEINLPIH